MTQVEKEKEIESWMPLISKLAGKFQNKISSFEDLVNDGITALIEGLEDYDPSNGVKEGYISKTIKRRIHDRAVTTSFTVHIPSGSLRLVDKKEINQMKGVNIDFWGDISERPELSYDYSADMDGYIDLLDIIERFDKDGIARLYFIEGLNYKEIAEKANCSIAKVCRHINKMRETITEKCM